MKPKFSDLITYINKALTGNDWNTNWQKIVNWLTLGTYDLKVNKIETNEIENSGSFQANQVIADNVQANTIQSNNFVGNGANLTDIKVSNIFAYTPFCVNSAKDSFIDITDTSKLVFLVDDGTLYKPLIVTTANGKQITITSINDYDVSGLNGTYYIFVDEETNGGTVYLKTCEIFRQDTEPTGQNGDIWFDVSNEPFVCREKVSNNWYSDEYNKVPVAKVVVTGGNIDSLTMLPFNQNGYNINTNTRIFGITVESLNSIVAGSNDTVYRDAVYPTLVICGSKEDASPQPSGWVFRLQVSTDGNTWKTVMDALGVDGGFMNSVIIGAGVYWKYTTGLTGNAYVEYAPIKGA